MHTLRLVRTPRVVLRRPRRGRLGRGRRGPLLKITVGRARSLLADTVRSQVHSLGRTLGLVRSRGRSLRPDRVGLVHSRVLSRGLARSLVLSPELLRVRSLVQSSRLDGSQCLAGMSCRLSLLHKISRGRRLVASR